MKISAETINRHHLLEIIFWPNEDGTFKTILNSAERLQELGIYDDYKMTIPMTLSEHITMHMAFMSDETKRKISKALTGKPKTAEHNRHVSEAKKGKGNHRNGRPTSEETKRKISEAKKGKPHLLSKKHWKLVDGKRFYY